MLLAALALLHQFPLFQAERSTPLGRAHCAGTHCDVREGVLICSSGCFHAGSTPTLAGFKQLTVKQVSCQVSGNGTISSHTSLSPRS